MTRGEEIIEAANKYSEYEYNESTANNGFIKGAKWADNNPKSPWINVKDKLPCDDKEMIVKYEVGLETRTKRVCVLLENGFTDITYMYRLPPCGWHWNIRDAITHWFPIPEPPK